ncbi:hypothetical protein L6452_13762 [Arctium lappa]|uniref:Uncharacterized protein n=1 Tax=Arctium lappa TaxID=4217 RepID=A0ACB9CJ45_ARCLA|nr:hypothetical protein L6452_13762 [Arctium lappa]
MVISQYPCILMHRELVDSIFTINGDTDGASVVLTVKLMKCLIFSYKTSMAQVIGVIDLDELRQIYEELPQFLEEVLLVKRICSNDPDASKKLKECDKAVMKLKFEEAIAIPTTE